MLLLFIVQKVIRFGVQSRIRSIHREFGIGPDDLNRMAESGLLSDEERKRINEAIARNLTRESHEVARSQTEGKVTAEALLRVELEKSKHAAAGKKAPAPGPALATRTEPPPLQASWTAREAPPSDPAHESFDGSLAPPEPTGTEPPQPDARPVDLELLLERGLLSREEYERLRSGGTDEPV